MAADAETTLKILEQIDSGLYGKVFRARQIDLDRIVAVKIIKSEFSHRADAIAHAKALARVGMHPNIVAVYSVQELMVEGKSMPAMVMEWLDGEKFGVRLAGPRFSEQELRRVCAGVIDGIERMHAAGMQHGDLHFGNVILLADCQPKIIDIDATQDRSLGRLSDVSRDGAIASDLDYCRQLVQRAFAHSVLSPSLVNSLDADLQSITSLAELRLMVTRSLDAPRVPSYGMSSPAVDAPETAEALSAKVQEYIETRRPASLFSLIMADTRALRDELLGDRFPVTARDVTREVVQQRLAHYQECVGPLLPALALGCYWGDETHWNVWKQCIETAANCYEDLGNEGRSGRKLLLDFRLYPPLLLFYAAALGAFLNNRIQTLRFLMDSLEYIDGGRRHGLVEQLLYWKPEQSRAWDELVLAGGPRHYSPVSDHLSDLCYRATGGLSTVRSTFNVEFDRFEYFLGLMRCPEHPDATAQDVSAPTGTFLWRRASDLDFSQHFLKEARERGDDWAPFQAGLFAKNFAVLERTIRIFDEYVDEQRDAIHIHRPRRQR